MKKISIYDIDMQYSRNTKKFVVLDNIRLTCLNSKDVVGRHGKNKYGDSFMRLEQRPVHDEKYEDAPSVLSFISHYSCGFGHRLHGLLGSYSSYLKEYEQVATDDMKILHFNSTPHVTGMNVLFAAIERKELYLVYDKQVVVIKKMVFFDPNNYRPDPQNRLAISAIREHLKTTLLYADATVIPLLSVLKTTNVTALDNPINPHGNLDGERIENILSRYEIKLVDHAKLTVDKLIILIMKSTLFVTNWGATSAWHSFLVGSQKCYCIVPFSYRGEVNSKHRLHINICFNPSCYNNYTVSKPVYNNIPRSSEQIIVSDLNKLLQ